MLDSLCIGVHPVSVSDWAQTGEFTVSVQGYLVGDGVWQIDACLRFRDGARLEAGGALARRGRAALLGALIREGARGRSLGARSVRLHMEMTEAAGKLDLSDLPSPSRAIH